MSTTLKRPRAPVFSQRRHLLIRVKVINVWIKEKIDLTKLYWLDNTYSVVVEQPTRLKIINMSKQK